MKKIIIGLFGASGRMGQELVILLNQEQDFELKYKIDISKDVKGDIKSIGECITPPHLVIDFSSPQGLEEILSYCVQSGIPLVSGTTGISPQQIDALKVAAQKIPILWSPNMSMGVAVVRELIKALGPLKNYDVQLEEFHHIRKKDKPSGTALLLQKDLETTFGRKLPEPVAIRGGGIFGVHKIQIMGEEELITIEHSALNRRVFARGAIFAARWLSKQKAGFYQMSDVLSI